MIYQQNFSIITIPHKILLTKPYFDIEAVMIYGVIIFVLLGSLCILGVIHDILTLPRRSKPKKINIENIKHELKHNSLETWMFAKGFLTIGFIGLVFLTPRLVAYDITTPADQLNATQIKIRRDYLADKYEEQTTKEKNLEEIQKLLTKLEDKNITVQKREEIMRRLSALEIE